MRTKTLGIIAAAVLFAGCGTSTERLAGTPSAGVISADNPIVWVSVTLTEEGKAELKENPKFKPYDLLREVRRGLQEKSLLSLREDTRFPALEIQIKEVRVRSTATATVFGPLTGWDMVTADVLLKSGPDKIADRYEVTAYYGHGWHTGGNDSTRLGWLYENFTKEMLKELTKPDKAS